MPQLQTLWSPDLDPSRHSAVVFELWHACRWALGKCDRADPEIANSCRRLLKLCLNAHINNIYILRMGGGEGGGAPGYSLSPDPPLLQDPDWL